jgi:hypothetical protein
MMRREGEALGGKADNKPIHLVWAPVENPRTEAVLPETTSWARAAVRKIEVPITDNSIRIRTV